MAEQDHYKILGLPRTASKEEIKKAFKKKALELHPDKNPGGEAEFKKLNHAYSILSDARQKAEYDRKHQPFGSFSGGHTRTTRSHTTNSYHSSAFPHSGYRKHSHPNPTSSSSSSHHTHTNTAERMEREKREAEQRRAYFNGGADFATWYKQKQKEMEEAEEVAKHATDKRRAEDERRRKAEEREAEDRQRREVEAQREAERRRTQARAEEEARRREYERREAERIERETREKHARALRDQQAAAADAEKHLQDVQKARDEEKKEREKQQAERVNVPSMDHAKAAELRAAREARAKQYEQDKIDAEVRIQKIKRDQQEEEYMEQRKKEKEREEAEQERAAALQREAAEREQEDLMEKEKREADEARKKRYFELEKKSKKFMQEVQDGQRKHREDILRMKEETQRMEEAAKAALEALRSEKMKIAMGLGGNPARYAQVLNGIIGGGAESIEGVKASA
eukprot:TRINITY_DN66447_c7_g1_i1.p1 TRINITY_DN66447_c7_g1~~TRINITY_DN66447_c7_g1_i1.p1  ORF type:complete len:456 (-),score=90.17 TRINITY_DN66447_c7_g1_i1:1174-2541(-)